MAYRNIVYEKAAKISYASERIPVSIILYNHASNIFIFSVAYRNIVYEKAAEISYASERIPISIILYN